MIDLIHCGDLTLTYAENGAETETPPQRGHATETESNRCAYGQGRSVGAFGTSTILVACMIDNFD